MELVLEQQGSCRAEGGGRLEGRAGAAGKMRRVLGALVWLGLGLGLGATQAPLKTGLITHTSITICQ